MECPYCGEWLEVDHDDVLVYEQDVKHEMQCSECEKHFVFMTSISYNYESDKADCLNGGDHNWELSHTAPSFMSRMLCTTCDESRELTDQERKKYNIESKESYFNKLRNESKKS